MLSRDGKHIPLGWTVIHIISGKTSLEVEVDLKEISAIADSVSNFVLKTPSSLAHEYSSESILMVTGAHFLFKFELLEVNRTSFTRTENPPPLIEHWHHFEFLRLSDDIKCMSMSPVLVVFVQMSTNVTKWSEIQNKSYLYTKHIHVSEI